MTIDEAIKLSREDAPQPEGGEVRRAYDAGELQTVEACLYVIAVLLRNVNARDEATGKP